AKRLGLPPPPELATFGLNAEENKMKRSEFLREVFVTKDVRVDWMNRNLIPPPRVVPIEGLVIKELESGIFFMNRNTDLAFQRENEFHLTHIVMEEPLSDGTQRLRKDSLSAKPQRAPQTYSSQRHRQGSRRLLEDILVSWDGYQLYELVKVVNSWQNCSQKYGRDVSKNGRALNAVVLPPQDS
ncbi:hypothetical protein Tco_1442911, partial [Tanacetum coccineum]